MFYLTTHSTTGKQKRKIIKIISLNFIEKEGTKEGNVLFNDAHNTFRVLWH